MLLEISLHELQLIYLDSSCPQMSSRIFLEVSEYFPSSKSIYGNYFIFGCNRKIFSKEKKKPILRAEFCPYGQQGLGPACLAAACFRVLAAVLACTAWMHGSASLPYNIEQLAHLTSACIGGTISTRDYTRRVSDAVAYIYSTCRVCQLPSCTQMDYY